MFMMLHDDRSLRICLPGATRELLSRLNALGRWEWRMGDSHWYGDYVSCIPFPGVRIRICDFPERAGDECRYRCDVRLSGGCSTTMEEVDSAFRAALAEWAVLERHPEAGEFKLSN